MDNDNVQRLCFTPGTEFMHRLQQTLLVYGATRSSLSRNKGLAVWVSVRKMIKRKKKNIFFNFFKKGSDCPGEGENKCFHHMRQIPAHHKCLVIGNDSDLIAYALRASSEVGVLF